MTGSTLYTSHTHRAILLISFTFVIFEIAFLSLYIDKFWFNIDIAWLGIPTLLVSLAAAHLVLIGLESDFSCQVFSLLFKGRPPIVYRKWISVDNEYLKYGIRYFRKSVIEEIVLTPFGNLLLQSRALCGAEQKASDILIKIPFSVAAAQEQKILIESIKSSCPNLIINKRLEKGISQKRIKGMQAVQMLSVLFMAVILLDLGQSSFYYLQMLKQYYLAQVEAKNNNAPIALKYLEDGDELLKNSPKWSLASSRFMISGPTAAHIYTARSLALHYLHRDDEAIEAALKALDLYPTNFRINLYLARLYTSMDKPNLAKQQVNEAIDSHRHSFLPKLYMICITDIFDGKGAAAQEYNHYLTELKEDTFADEPIWPPGGNRFLSEVFHSEDIDFVFNNLTFNPDH